MMGLKRILDRIRAKDKIKYPGLIPEGCSYNDLLCVLESEIKAKQVSTNKNDSKEKSNDQ
jgi:hypothetical protein